MIAQVYLRLPPREHNPILKAKGAKVGTKYQKRLRTCYRQATEGRRENRMGFSRQYNKAGNEKKRYDRKRKERSYAGHCEETMRFHRLKTINPVKTEPTIDIYDVTKDIGS